MCKKILVVEKNEYTRCRYARMLRRLHRTNVLVKEAADVVEVFEQLLKSSPFDLILLDLNIGEWNGRELFDLIQEFDPRLNIIVTSFNPVGWQRDYIPEAKDHYDKSKGAYPLLLKVTMAMTE